MNVPLYEKIWMWAAGGISVGFVATLLITSIGGELQPPSHVETIDGATVIAVGMTAVAVLLVLVAYAYPLWSHLQRQRFGSPGFTPF